MISEVKQISAVEQVGQIIEAASADGHYVCAPTHYWTDEHGNVAGYFSSGILPVTHFWMRRDSKPRESLTKVRECVEIMRRQVAFTGGMQIGMIACKPNSPFHPTLEKHFGFKKGISGTDLFSVDLS